MRIATLVASFFLIVARFFWLVLDQLSIGRICVG